MLAPLPGTHCNRAIQFMSKTTVLLALTLICLSPPADSQENLSPDSGAPAATAEATPSVAGEVQRADPENIEEVTVVGMRTRKKLRQKIVMAESRVFSLFNELNDDDGYDIICKRRTRVGSQIPYRVCKARLYWEGLAELAEDQIDDESPSRPAVANAQKHTQILREKMGALAKGHPKLREILRERYQLRQAFEATKKEQP